MPRVLPDHMKPKEDLVGQKFGSLTAFGLVKVDNRSFWSCLCDCGNERLVQRNDLTRKRWPIHSCGCKNVEKDPYTRIVKMMLAQYKCHRSKGRGHSFELTLDDFLRLCRQPCFYCGGIFERTFQSDTAYVNGLDRINSTLGYTPNNVTPCCSRCNYAKGTMEQAEFMQWITQVYNHLGATK